MQKLLFICYGLYYAQTGRLLFEDDSPKAWPYGPVFPRVNKRYDPALRPSDLTDEERKLFLSSPDALLIADAVVRKYSHISAHELSEWSHSENGPWHKTIYGEDGKNTEIQWNKPIPHIYILSYFQKWLLNG